MAGGDNVLVDPLSLILRQPVCVGTLGLLKNAFDRAGQLTGTEVLVSIQVQIFHFAI